MERLNGANGWSDKETNLWTKSFYFLWLLIIIGGLVLSKVSLTIFITIPMIITLLCRTAFDHIIKYH